MNFKQLLALSDKNDVRVDNFRGYAKSIPYYYDSLRHAFSFYCNTFVTNNTSYAFYAEGLHKRNVRILKHQFLDEDNTVLTLIAFERFFELLLKDLLSRVNKKFVLVLTDTNNNGKLVSIERLRGGTREFITGIGNNSYAPKKIENKTLSIPFRETFARFYGLLDFAKQNPNLNKVGKEFLKLISQYPFLDSKEYKEHFNTLTGTGAEYFIMAISYLHFGFLIIQLLKGFFLLFLSLLLLMGKG